MEPTPHDAPEGARQKDTSGDPRPQAAPEDTMRPQAEPEDTRPTPDDVTIRGLIQSARLVLAFPVAFFPPFIVGIVLIHTVPPAVVWAIVLLGTALAWAALVLSPAIQFTADYLVVGLVFRHRRIAWADITSIGYSEFTDSETGEAIHRLITVRYRRNPDQPLPPMPSKFGEIMQWSSAHFRSVPLPLTFPPSPAPDGSPRHRTTSWRWRVLEGKREIVLRELAARGYQLPD